MKRKLLFAALCVVSAFGQLRAQTDVTDKFLTNPGFEGDNYTFYTLQSGRIINKPKGWSVSYTQESTSDKNTQSFVSASETMDDKVWSANSGKAYFFRCRWTNCTFDLRQTIGTLPPGAYTLKFYAKGVSGTGMSFSASVGGQDLTIPLVADGTEVLSQQSINFTITSSTPYTTIHIHAQKSGGTLLKVALDEFSLWYDGSSYYETILKEAGNLYNNNKDWATEAETLQTAISEATGKETIEDKNAAIFSLKEAMQTFKNKNTTDMTDRITNPNFDSNISGWTTSGSDGTWQRQTSTQKNYNGGFIETWRNAWNGTYNHKNLDMYQDLTSLPNGEYTIKAAIGAPEQGSAETQGNAAYGAHYHGGPYYVDDSHGAWLYASSGETTTMTWANTENNNIVTGAGPEYFSTTINVTNGSLRIGAKAIGSEAGGTTIGTYTNWFSSDNWTLSYFGFDPTTLKADISSLQTTATTLLANEDYNNVIGKEKTELTTASTLVPTDEKKSTLEAAITQIQGAIDAFTAAKTNYDALVAEIAKAKALGIADATANSYAATSSTTAASALTSTQSLKVEEYTYVTTNYPYGVSLGEWTSEGTNTSAATFSNEHWSGETHNYKNQNDNNGQGYNANSWSISFSQNVDLPAGNYIFKVAGRQASGDKVTTSLKVMKGDEVLGEVSDFPRSNNSRGINKSGATAFEGANDDFANNGKGYGWEWRYVKFTLNSDATVNIAVNSVATAKNQWVSFGDYTLQTDNEANISLIAYNVALNNASTVNSDDTYSSVTGSEKTTLEEAIDADESLDKTDKDAIDAAIETLNNAVAAFTAAKAAYDAFVAAKAVTYENNLHYASSTKFAAIATAQEAVATSASDAETKTAAIISAYRKYVESNALAEGVDNSVQIDIPDYRFAEMTNSDIDAANWKIGDNWWLDGQNNGTINLRSEETFTDGDNKADYTYIDIAKNDNNAGIHQTINLQPGKYLMTVTARCQSGQGAKFEAFAGGVYGNIPQQGNSGGQFGRGWNDVSIEFDVAETGKVNIGVKSDYGKNIWWSATRFRLVRIQDGAVMAVKANKWGTFVTPFAVTEIPEGIEAYTISSISGNAIKLSDALSSIPAKTPVILKNTTNDPISETFYGDLHDVEECGDDYLKGVFTNKTIAASDETTSNYVLQTKGEEGSEIQGFYKVNSEFTATPNRCYLTVPASSGEVKAFFFDDGETAIQELVNGESVKGQWYNLSGQRVNKAQKGIYIINGKKVVK